MGNPILETKPNVVNENIEAHSYMFYSVGKTGKTRLANSFPNSFMFDLEKSGDCIPGIMRKEIVDWEDLELWVSYLADPEVKKKFKMIIFDTGDKMLEMAKEYLRVQYNKKLREKSTNDDGSVKPYKKAETFGDMNVNGKQWEQAGLLVSKLLDKVFRIYGYGLILNVHCKEVVEKVKDSDGKEISIKTYTTDVNDRYGKMFNNLVDVIGFIQNEDVMENGVLTSKPFVYFRGSRRFFAGSRFKYIQTKAEFNYRSVEKAIKEAIKKEKELAGNEFFIDEDKEMLEDPEIQEKYDKCMDYIKSIHAYLFNNFKNHATMSFNDFWNPQLQDIINKNLGKKVSETTKEDLEGVMNTARDIQNLIKRYSY